MRNKHRDMLEEIRSEAEKKKLQQQLLQVCSSFHRTSSMNQTMNSVITHTLMTGISEPSYKFPFSSHITYIIVVHFPYVS